MQDLGVVDESQDTTPGRDVFPHDRVVFFSDAVFAIAITLLAIELRLPTPAQMAGPDAQAFVNDTTSLFMAYFVSFAVTGLFWTSHMLTWKHVTRVNGKLVWCTIANLMFVALMPFATREYSAAFSGDHRGRYALYACVLTGISLFSVLTRALVVRQEHLRTRIGDAETNWLLWRGLVPLSMFAVSIPLAFVLPTWSAGFVFLLIFPVLRVVKRRVFRASSRVGEGA